MFTIIASIIINLTFLYWQVFIFILLINPGNCSLGYIFKQGSALSHITMMSNSNHGYIYRDKWLFLKIFCTYFEAGLEKEFI